MFGADGGYGTGELIVLEPQFNQLRRFKRIRKRAAEFIIRHMNFLERSHALESILRDTAGELVVRQVQRLERAELLPIGHGPLELVAHEAEGPQETKRDESVRVDLALESHVLELQPPDVAIEAENARPIAGVAGARSGQRAVPIGEGRVGVLEGGLELEERIGFINLLGADE